MLKRGASAFQFATPLHKPVKKGKNDGDSRIYFCLIFVTLALHPHQLFAQKPANAPAVGTAAVAGRISVDGGVLAGILVLLRQVSDAPVNLTQAPPLTAVTDTDGNYQFTNILRGNTRWLCTRPPL